MNIQKNENNPMKKNINRYKFSQKIIQASEGSNDDNNDEKQFDKYYSESMTGQSFQDLQDQLILIHQANLLTKFFKKLSEKAFWLEFYAFKKISLFQIKHRSKQNRNNSLKMVLYSHLCKNYYQKEIKWIGMSKFKQISLDYNLINHKKTEFFIKYFIDAEYTKLSIAFSKIKSFSEKGPLAKQKSKQYINQAEEEKQKLLKLQKQSKKYRAKYSFVFFRNFLKKYIKNVFNSIKLHQSSQQFTNLSSGENYQNNNSKLNSKTILNEAKDARFIKKKIVPHKVIQQNSTKRQKQLFQTNTFNLGHIHIGNYEIQSLKKRHFQSINMMMLVINSNVVKSFNSFFSILHQLQPFKQQKEDINGSLDSRQQEQDFSILKNVMKTMCYVSSRTERKRQKQKKIQQKLVSVKSLTLTLRGRLLQSMRSGYFSIKMCILRQNLLISLRVKELQQIKRQCLQYFNNSLVQPEEDQD